MTKIRTATTGLPNTYKRLAPTARVPDDWKPECHPIGFSGLIGLLLLDALMKVEKP